MPLNLELLRLQLTRHEGCRLVPYKCQAGKWTIGIGRNLDDVGISRVEAFQIDQPALAGKVKHRVWGDSLNGINVAEISISPGAAFILLDNDILDRVSKLEKLGWFSVLDDVRQRVCVDMAFQMGFAGFMGFKETIWNISKKDFISASECMLMSRWAKQTPARARRLAQMMKTGMDPDWLGVV